MSKPFQGIITDWTKHEVGDIGLGFRIIGTCLRHEDKPAADQLAQALRDTIHEGLPMYTSYVVSLTDMDGFSIVETRNSRYILIGEPSK